jgi:hypothetical protein
MGLIAKILGYARKDTESDDITADPGGGNLVTANPAQPAGDDSQPLPGDYVAAVRVPGLNRMVSVGVFDTQSERISGPGEKRLYGRSADGDTVCHVWLKADGTVLVSNGSGAITLQPDGVVDINGATIGTDGTITSPTSVVSPSVVADGKELTDHDHDYSWTDPAGSGTTEPNN